TAWFSRFAEAQFRRTVDLVGGFVTYRLTRQHGRKLSGHHDPTDGLIPSFSGSGPRNSAQLHAALGVQGISTSSTSATTKPATKKTSLSLAYSDDWQIRAAAKVMSILFSANSNGLARKPYSNRWVPTEFPQAS